MPHTGPGRSSDFLALPSGLPIRIFQDSGTSWPEEFFFPLEEKKRGYSDGIAPDFHGVPY